MSTVHTYTNLGFRTMPIGQSGYTLVRDDNGKKHINNSKGNTVSFKDAMPSKWTQVYGARRKKHSDTPLGGLICGELNNKEPDEVEVIALDCDNQAAWDLLVAMDPDYLFRFRSVGKPGGTILYELPEELRELKQYSINNGTIILEYMAKRESGANAMIYLPTEANKTKENIPKGAELSQPPQTVIHLLKSLKPQELVVQEPSIAPDNKALPFNAPLAKQYILEAKAVASDGKTYGLIEGSPVAEKLYSIFTPKKFRSAQEYKNKGYLHPNSEAITAIAPYSEYITGLSAIAGSDPSIDVELYVSLMQAINAQLDDPYPPTRYLDEVINPMIHNKASINGKPIWKYNESWDKNSHSVSNQYGETLEYFANITSANEFIEYNHSTSEVVYVKGLSQLLDRVYTMDSDPQQEKPTKALVKKLKLVTEENTVKLEPGIFTDNHGKTIINSAKAKLPLRILRHPEIFETPVNEYNPYVQAFNLFVNHLVNNDKLAADFMRTLLAWHGRNLINVPVIIYMVGVGGAGKSQFSNILEALFGSNTTRRPTALQMNSRFNDYLDNCALLVMSETADVSKQDQKNLKSLMKTVTGEKTIDIEAKRKPIRPNVPLFALPLVLANDFWYVEDDNDRRLFTINPTKPLHSAPDILDFEQEHGVRIVDFIIEGINKGYISKYLSQFCPVHLPEVPTTQDKLESSQMQDDIVSVVKSIVAQQDWYAMFNLMEEYNYEDMFKLFEQSVDSKHHETICNHLYIGHLVSLTIEMRGDSNYPTDHEIKKAYRPRVWLSMKDTAKPNTAGTGPTNYKRVGRYKWEYDNILEAYEAWKLKSLESTDGEY